MSLCVFFLPLLLPLWVPLFVLLCTIKGDDKQRPRHALVSVLT